MRSSIIAERKDFFSTSSNSALLRVTSCICESIRDCKVPDWPLRAFFCKRNVSVERFFNSVRQRLYSLACSLSMVATERFQSSNFSYKNANLVKKQAKITATRQIGVKNMKRSTQVPQDWYNKSSCCLMCASLVLQNQSKLLREREANT
uniref:Uncharacterized protein n=1 Tax=Glossina austeni TaxID=7395 RepID=A0A1A9VSR5_GLOAU